MSSSAMPTRELGRSGLKVSAIGLGCMGFSFGLGDRSNLKEEDSIATIREAFKLGINFFDTALVYGPHTNEVLVGKALSIFPREQLVIATKCGLDIDASGRLVRDGRPESIRAAVEGSLQRLGVTYIDLYYLHRVDPNVPIEDVARTMLELKNAGKIRHWGLSEPTAETIRRAHAVFPLTAVQSEYSIMHRLPEGEVFLALEELGIGFVPFSPLGRGFLTGTIAADVQLGDSDSRRTMPRFTSENIKANAPIVALVEEYAEKKKASPAQVALAWVMAQRPYIAPIPGTTKLARLQENVGAVEVLFTDAEMKDFNARLSSLQVHGARYPPSAMALLERPDDFTA